MPVSTQLIPARYPHKKIGNQTSKKTGRDRRVSKAISFLQDNDLVKPWAAELPQIVYSNQAHTHNPKNQARNQINSYSLCDPLLQIPVSNPLQYS